MNRSVDALVRERRRTRKRGMLRVVVDIAVMRLAAGKKRPVNDSSAPATVLLDGGGQQELRGYRDEDPASCSSTLGHMAAHSRRRR